MGRTKRSTRKFNSRKQNNHRQKKTRHIKYRKHRKHGKISERNKSKRKNRKIFWGGTPNREEMEQHERRFNKIKQFLLMGNMYNFFIKPENFKTLSDDTHINIIYNKLKDIIGSDTKNFINKIDQHFKDINIFRLYDDDGEFNMNSPNYMYIIKMLAEFIDKDSCIQKIHSKSTGFNSIVDINPNYHNIRDSGNIRYITEIYSDYLSQIITSFNDISYKYYLTLDANIFRELLSDEEIAAAAKQAQEAAEKQAQEAAEKAKGNKRVAQLRQRGLNQKLSRHESP